jgi:hypothetical protein
MEKEFVPYQLAVKLKALGFDEPCFKYIYTGDTGNNYDHYEEIVPSKALNFNADDLCISQPTFSQAFRWFREKKLADGSVSRHGEADGSYSYRWDIVYEERHFQKGYRTYEEAELACLETLIKHVESKSE